VSRLFLRVWQASFFGCRSSLSTIRLPGLLEATSEVLEAIRAPVVITAPTPWRPVGVLARRRWLEARASEAILPERADSWRSRHPELSEEQAIDLAAHFRSADRRWLPPQTWPGPPPDWAGTVWCLPESWPPPASRFLPRVRTGWCRSSSLRWKPRDLVLTAALHQQVTELAAFARCLHG
jgi:hypothetical protein